MKARGRRADTPGQSKALYRSGAVGKAGRGCGKLALSSRRAALGEARRKGWDDAYRCDVCGKWHAGRKRPPPGG